VKILFYGRLADSFGPEMEFASDSACTVAELRDRLVAQNPGAAGALRSKRTRALVADTVVADDYLLDPVQAVEFLPPVSGG
jgi:molybdopterin converting factor small subunit